MTYDDFLIFNKKTCHDFSVLVKNCRSLGFFACPWKTNAQIGHIPYCKVEWNSPEATSQEEFDQSYKIRFDIDMQSKQVVGMTLTSKRFFKPDPKVDIVPELESDYRNRMQNNILTNAPAHINTGPPPHIPLKKE
jgi:hypothetical protein